MTLAPEPARDWSQARCDRCVWARRCDVALTDGFATSDQVVKMPALWCHAERPRLQVDPSAFCPDFEARPPSAPRVYAGRRGGRPAPRSDD